MRTVLFILFLVAASIFADDAYHESVSVEAVNIFALAKDGNGKLVPDLHRDEFTVLENGISQSILDVSNFAKDKSSNLSGKDVPLSITFALDISASMASTLENKKRIEVAKSAILMLMDELNSQDKMMLVSFSRYPKILTSMTSNKQEVEDLLLVQRPSDEKTAIYDSLSDVLDQMKDSTGTKILVLCTDGEDNSSKTTFDTFLNKISGMDVLVLAFSIPSGEENPQQRYEISKIAERTGGYAFFPQNMGELKNILTQIRKAMRNQYSIWYRPTNSTKDGHWRSIQILCSRPGIELYHRPGYFAR
ncbi:MAG TPA: VWA domain-containing protein [Acidobacteriota bacterium]|jgi:Ca-activated chloride channel family protein